MKKKVRLFSVIGIIMVLSVVLSLGLVRYQRSRWREPKFENTAYEGVFCAMDSVPGFSEEDFLAYRGLKIVKADMLMESFDHIVQMLEIVFSNHSDVHTIYMELNPVTLWNDAGAQEDKWNEYINQYILETVKQYENTTFEILLPHPEITYWTGLTAEDFEEYVNVYALFVKSFEDVGNVVIHYVGAEQWLCSNTDNYEDIFQLNSQVEKNIFLSTLCDRKYVVDSERMNQKLEQLRELVAGHADWSTGHPDFSEWNFVFLGDSIIDIDMGSSSIPGVVGALTGAASYNCGEGGAAATTDAEKGHSFLHLVDILITGNVNDRLDAELQNNFEAFLQKKEEKNNLCFFINFGLNDYFQGYAVDNLSDPYDIGTYAGALRTGILRLQEAYPKAEIVVMVPTYTNFLGEGTEIISEEGAVLDVYRNVVQQVAEEMQVYCKNNYTDMPIDATNYTEYLSDGCHPNEKGRFILGEQIIQYLEENVIQ